MSGSIHNANSTTSPPTPPTLLADVQTGILSTHAAYQRAKGQIPETPPHAPPSRLVSGATRRPRALCAGDAHRSRTG